MDQIFEEHISENPNFFRSAEDGKFYCKYCRHRILVCSCGRNSDGELLDRSFPFASDSDDDLYHPFALDSSPP